MLDPRSAVRLIDVVFIVCVNTSTVEQIEAIVDCNSTFLIGLAPNTITICAESYSQNAHARIIIC